jgi:hypothetical protein
MRDWNLTNTDVLSLVLSNDVRLGATDYVNDHTWEISLRGGDPLGLVIQTTFGLRARAFRVFPRFSEGEIVHTDPNNFHRSPTVRHVYPNLITLDFSPFPGIDVIAEYWVPEPHALACRYRLSNRGKDPRSIRLEILGQLIPTEGQRMAPTEIQAAWVLAGQTSNLFPVIFLTGGPQTGTGSYPSLQHLLEIPPGETQSTICCLGAGTSQEASFEQARRCAARKWESERAYIDLLNSAQIEIYTGDPDWDAAFMLAQCTAFRLVSGPTTYLPYPSFVLSRQPDQGYSLRGDGSDYNHLWNGQPALESYYLSGYLLPGSAELLQGILRNFLAIQTENGMIDWKPGLAGQRSFILSTPILATLAWRIYQVTTDQDFLFDVFPGLLKFLYAWFTPGHDRDHDGIPEWDHPSQANTDDHPLYSRWHPWSFGTEISTAESPGLCAFLYKECDALIQIASLLNQETCIPELQELSERLRMAVETSWDTTQSIYHDVDRDTHASTKGELLGEIQGVGKFSINRNFEHPVRLLVHISSADGVNRRPELVIHGANEAGQARVEKIGPERFKWFLGRGIFTGERVFSALEYLEILEVEPEDRIKIFTAGYQSVDLAGLLPLWAGIPDATRARTMVEDSITNPARFWRPGGLPFCIEPWAPEATIGQNVNMIWNTLIGEALVQYGYRETAAELVTHLMKDIIQNLKKHKAFRRYYHAEIFEGDGEQNPLQGLAPISLFLETLGVRLMSQQQLLLTGFNPYPWPVTVKYRGMTVLRRKDISTVIFPDGQDLTVDDPAPHLISLQSGET